MFVLGLVEAGLFCLHMLTNHSPVLERVVFDAATDEITNTNVEFKRSFKCLANQNLSLSQTNKTIKISPLLSVKNFQMQVFKFDDANTGEFGKGM